MTDVLLKDRDRALAAAADRAAKAAPGVLIDTDQLAGQPAQAVTEAGSGALMLVVGSRGGGAFTAMVLGSVSRYAAAHASGPVVVVRDDIAGNRRWSASASATWTTAPTRSPSRSRRRACARPA